MNCLYETVAGTYLRIRGKFAPPEDGEAMLGDAEESLEAHRASLLARERDLAYQCGALAKTALAKKNANDLPGARFVMQERRSAVARLDKLRGGITLIDKQLNALRSSELDRELMASLRASNAAMKRAGIGIGVEDAEKVMNELDDQIRDASELTITMATPLADAVGPGMMMSDLDDELSRELDEELGLLEHGATADPQPLSGASRTPLPPIPEASAGAQAMSDEEPARPQSRAPVPVSTMQEDW